MDFLWLRGGDRARKRKRVQGFKESRVRVPPRSNPFIVVFLLFPRILESLLSYDFSLDNDLEKGYYLLFPDAQ
jgi:hypothetical protein